MHAQKSILKIRRMSTQHLFMATVLHLLLSPQKSNELGVKRQEILLSNSFHPHEMSFSISQIAQPERFV